MSMAVKNSKAHCQAILDGSNRRSGTRATLSSLHIVRDDLLGLISGEERGLRTQKSPQKRAEILKTIDALAALASGSVTTDESPTFNVADAVDDGEGAALHLYFKHINSNVCRCKQKLQELKRLKEDGPIYILSYEHVSRRCRYGGSAEEHDPALAMEEAPSVSDEKNQVVCERMIEKSLNKNPTVKFMLEALQKAGCPVTQKFFKSEHCSVKAGGGFVPQIGISICSNHLLTVTQGEVDQILTHELVHAYDHCRAANLDWSNCQHHACSEIRAANLSGDCKWMLELLRGHTNIRQQHQVCVRRRAQLSVSMNPHCSERDAKKAVDAAWTTCYQDTQPFDRVP